MHIERSVNFEKAHRRCVFTGVGTVRASLLKMCTPPERPINAGFGAMPSEHAGARRRPAAGGALHLCHSHMQK
jgi:hypothetical protein